MVGYRDIESKAKSLSEERNIEYYELLQRFMFERILERISISKYNSNFILKGGLLLSAMFGIDNRSTKDMDTAIIGLNIDKKEMIKILKEILLIDLNDGVKFELIDVTDIREEDEYGGNKYHIVGRLQNLKVNLDIDISTGDKITPRELKFKYPLIFNNKEIIINSYNMETIIAEKMQTILKRNIYNSRMKDFYDIYLFITKFSSEIDYNNLRKAIKNTFSKRNSENNINDYEVILKNISENDRLNKLWDTYKNKRSYVMEITLSNIIAELIKFIEINHLLK